MSEPEFIPFHRPSIGQEELEEVAAVLQSGWLTTGPKTRQFEQEFAAYCGAPHALAVNSCTAGLHLALAALDVGPGDEVITTPMTFCSTVHVITHTGATPVLADIGDDGNLDPASVEERITPRTRVLLPVHLAGLPCRMEELWALAARHGLHVVEDAAHAAGARYGSRRVAGDPRSAAVAFSFYATKNLTTAEGGMVTAFDPYLAERMRVLCLHGISRDAWNRYTDKGNWYYEVLEPGFKYNLSDLQSAVGVAQLRKLEGFLARRRELVAYYNERFRRLEELELPPGDLEGGHAWHLYILRLRLERLKIGRGEFIEELRKRGVGASVHFIPVPLHPAFRELAVRKENDCPRAAALYERIVSLPLYPGMTLAMVERVANTVEEIVRLNRTASFVPKIGLGRGRGGEG